MALKIKVEKPVDTPIGAVIYSDGGCKPSRGHGGWGMHGYVYSDQSPTKGSGNSTQYLTKYGYIEKSSERDKTKIEEVKPLNYVNGYGSFSDIITNNVAEIAGATNGLNYAINNNLKYITIVTDSEHVVNGSTKWLNSWKMNNWLKADGIPPTNLEYWQALDNSLEQLKANGTTVDIKWVKGHSTHIGNQIADKLASIGVLQSKEGNVRNEVDTVRADGYWTTTIDKNPFITHKRIYFSTRPESINIGEYFLGDHGKDDELLGKRTADGCYSYIILKTPEPAIEIMRSKQVKLATGLDVIIMGRVDKLFEANTYKDILSYGDICLYSPYNDKLDMHFVDNEPVTKELRPPKLAMRAVESVNTLKGILLAWQSGNDKNIIDNDITDIIYEIDAKGEYKLRTEFIVGFSSLPIEVNCGNEKKEKIDICLGVDLPERNYLKRMEKLKPKVTLITWKESESMFRYATIVKTDDDIGIYAGMYSNAKFIV